MGSSSSIRLSALYIEYSAGQPSQKLFKIRFFFCLLFSPNWRESTKINQKIVESPLRWLSNGFEFYGIITLAIIQRTLNLNLTIARPLYLLLCLRPCLLKALPMMNHFKAPPYAQENMLS